jgi:hypothetical protein
MRFLFLTIYCLFFSACDTNTQNLMPYIWKKPQIESTALSNFMASPAIDPEVEKLANLGFQRYSDNTNDLMTNRDAARPNNGAGRKKSWIKDTFDSEEDDIIEALKSQHAPQTFSIKQIDDLYGQLTAQIPRGQNLKKTPFVYVTGVNINYLHEAPIAQEAFVQLASQFNYLESVSPNISPVSSYLYDPTQGPMGSIEAAAAALHRTATEASGELKNALTNVLPPHHDNYYRNGYLELFKLSDAEKTALRKHVEKNIKELAILPHWVKNEASGVKQFQVFSAAPSYQGHGAPAANSEEGMLTSLLVAAQFEALAKLAVIRNLLTNKPTTLHLARVGQGAFNNPPEALNHALKRVAEVVKGYPDVHVFVHGFGKASTQANKDATDTNLVDISYMNNQEFFKAPFPSLYSSR